jgi:hypothetical protein
MCLGIVVNLVNGLGYPNTTLQSSDQHYVPKDTFLGNEVIRISNESAGI